MNYWKFTGGRELSNGIFYGVNPANPTAQREEIRPRVQILLERWNNETGGQSPPLPLRLHPWIEENEDQHRSQHEENFQNLQL